MSRHALERTHEFYAPLAAFDFRHVTGEFLLHPLAQQRVRSVVDESEEVQPGGDRTHYIVVFD